MSGHGDLRFNPQWQAGPAIGGQPSTGPDKGYLLLVQAREHVSGKSWWEIVAATVDDDGQLCDQGGNALSYTWGDVSWVAELDQLVLPPLSA